MSNLQMMRKKNFFRFVTGVLAIASLALLLSQGFYPARADVRLQVADTDTPTATATQTETAMVTVTSTATETATVTATATVTETPTPTSTGTVTLTPTVTRTSTPTITGTPPTPTATGTITPNPVFYMVVSPSQARVNEQLTFTIFVRNDGTAPLSSASVSNTFPTFLDVQDVTTTKGTISKSQHSVQVSLTNVFPGETIVVVVPVRVNSSLTNTMTLQNIATLTGSNITARTTYVYYSVLVTQVLPGTGELPVEEGEADYLETILTSSITGAVSIGILLIVLFLGKSKRLSSVTLLSVIVFVLAVIGVSCIPETGMIGREPLLESPVNGLITPTRTLMPFMPAFKFITPEPYTPLPDYPIPTPEVQTTQASDTPTDTSSVVRLVIPSLSVDAIVKYVPYDDVTKTWLIDGLRDEIAWLGNTSWPGLGGNTVLAGHITVRGLGNGPFRFLENVTPQDQITLYTEAYQYTYQVREQVIVNETDMGVVLPTVGTQLTLITCTGWDDELEIYRYRRVVFADLLKAEPLTIQSSLR